MSKALIDNASLTAIQRIFGQITVFNPDTRTSDLLALENLINAILFYDEIICIDNYKDKYREERKKLFPFIKFIDPDKYGLNSLDLIAKNEARKNRPIIRGGEFVNDDFYQFIESLKMNIVCTWDLSSSVYYLTMKMLGQPNTSEYEKYSNLSTAIFNELSEVKTQKNGYFNKDVVLYSSTGERITKNDMEKANKKRSRGLGGISKQLEMFIASLNWITYKTIYYTLAAKNLWADTFLHPIRQNYQLNWITKSNIYGGDFTSKIVQLINNNINKDLVQVFDNGRNISERMNLPIFSVWIMDKIDDVRVIIEFAFELRNDPAIRDFRNQIKELRNFYDDNNLSGANKKIHSINRMLEKASFNILNKYNISHNQGSSILPVIKIINSITNFTPIPNIPEIDLRLKLPEIKLRNTFGIMYRNIVEDIIVLERAGRYYDKLTSKYNFDMSRYVEPKTEDPQFRNHESDWKIPM